MKKSQDDELFAATLIAVLTLVIAAVAGAVADEDGGSRGAWDERSCSLQPPGVERGCASSVAEAR